MKIKKGGSRIVFIGKEKVYKIPNFIDGWSNMIFGFVENLQERYWYTADGQKPDPESSHWKFLAKIYYADPFGFLVVMERAMPLTYDQYITHPYVIDFVKSLEGYNFHSDLKYKNLGWRPLPSGDYEPVVIDYGFVTSNLYMGDVVSDTWPKKYFFMPLRRLGFAFWNLLERIGIYER